VGDAVILKWLRPVTFLLGDFSKGIALDSARSNRAGSGAAMASCFSDKLGEPITGGEAAAATVCVALGIVPPNPFYGLFYTVIDYIKKVRKMWG